MPDIQDIVSTYLASGTTASEAELSGNPPDIRPKGPLEIGGQGLYDFNYRQFPLDLGSEYNEHYVVFNINVPVKSGASATMRVPDLYDIPGVPFTQATELANDYSTTDQLRFGGNVPSFDLFTQGANAQIPRYTRRIAESIALHMPTPLIYTSTNVYEDISLTSLAGQAGKLAGTAAGKLLAAAVGGGLTGRIGAGIAGGNFGGQIVGAAGNIFGTAMQLAGYPINPRIEVLFANTLQRQFAFEFLMAPRNEEESIAMDNIIRTFKFHGAPAIDETGNDPNSGLLGGIAAYLIPWYVPPAEFDIKFFQNGVENEAIPRVNTCVLERIEVDFQPQGMFATFSNGYPVACRLSLAFRETEVITKQRVAQGF